jgi:AraC-like DNA-binding protein
MRFRHYFPPPPLSDFVHLFWYYEGYELPHEKERILPDGRMALMVNLREESLPVYEHPQAGQSFTGAAVSGAHARSFVIDTECQAHIIGVHFRLGGAFPFFAEPADAMRDSHIALCDLWGGLAGELRHRLLEAPTPEAKLLAFEAFLLARLRKPLARHPAVAFALRALAPHDGAPGARVADVAERAGFSQRQFIQLFKQEVGLTPKAYGRVQRFHQVVRLAHAADEIDWTDLALSCGYFDQAHFIHDFQTFAGMRPSDYLAARGPDINHVPLG